MDLEAEYKGIVKNIGQRIKYYRLKSGYSQTDMQQFGFDIKNYQKLEYGKSCSLYTLHRLARAFGCSIEDLANEKPAPRIKP